MTCSGSRRDLVTHSSVGLGGKGYGLETMRMHQLRGQVVCLRQKKTTGASSGNGTTSVLRSLAASSGPTSSMMSSPWAGPKSSHSPAAAWLTPSGMGHSSVVMATQQQPEEMRRRVFRISSDLLPRFCKHFQPSV